MIDIIKTRIPADKQIHKKKCQSAGHPESIVTMLLLNTHIKLMTIKLNLLSSDGNKEIASLCLSYTLTPCLKQFTEGQSLVIIYSPAIYLVCFLENLCTVELLNSL